MIESQSGGEVERKPQGETPDEEYAIYLQACDDLEADRLDTLKQNAINQGHLEADIEVKYITEAEYQIILEAEKPIPTYQDLRRAEYPSINDMTVALWEDVVEGRPKTRIALQVEREAIKIKYPKE